MSRGPKFSLHTHIKLQIQKIQSPRLASMGTALTSYTFTQEHMHT